MSAPPAGEEQGPLEVVDPDEEDDEEETGAAPEDPEADEGLPRIDPSLWTRARQTAAEEILATVLADPLPGREMVLRYRDIAAALPDGEALIRLFAHVAQNLVHRRAILKKHGLWTWIPEEAREEIPTEPKRKARAPAIASYFVWPPLSEPTGQLLDAGEGQARMWVRCARGGCWAKQEVIFYTVGLSPAQKKRLAAEELARGWACPVCVVILAERARDQERRAAVAAALRAAEKPLPSPSVICTLLAMNTLATDDRARDQLRIHRDQLDAATFHRMMALVFAELERLAPQSKSPAKLAQHRARLGAFRIFAGGPVALPARPSPARAPRPRPSPERRSP